MRRILFVVLIALLLFFGCEFKKTDEEQIRNTIEGYYAASYDMWWNLKIEDLSAYLDLSSVQCHNKIVVLEENIEKWKYAIKKGYYKGQRERHEIFYDFDLIEINGDEAQVKVNLSGETTGTPAYPFFVSLGDNTFKLRKSDGKWLIYSHEYTDAYFYEKSTTEKLELDINKVHDEVERDYR